MRIIGGEASGRPLKAPKGRNTRPTTDRVRESLFSILGDVSELVVCDAFAGSGALGLEALSRGAAHAWFFEIDRAALAALRENIANLGWEDRCSVIPRSFEQAFAQVSAQLDLLFLDPPYEQGMDVAALDAAVRGSLRTDALVVVERSARDPDLVHWGFDHDEDRRYGETILTFMYRNAQSGAPDGV
jgi:16S rRNA (guanine966-N2)-methyltransferase